MRNVAVVMLVNLTFACGGPMGPIPGSELEGPELPWPSDWTFTDTLEYILLETRTEDPYSVTLYGVYIEQDFYVAGVSKESAWVQFMLQDANVRLGIGGDLYRGRASQVNDPVELRQVGDRYAAKYDIETGQDSTFIEDGGIIFRITAP